MDEHTALSGIKNNLHEINKTLQEISATLRLIQQRMDAEALKPRQQQSSGAGATKRANKGGEGYVTGVVDNWDGTREEFSVGNKEQAANNLLTKLVEREKQSRLPPPADE